MHHSPTPQFGKKNAAGYRCHGIIKCLTFSCAAWPLSFVVGLNGN
jgi:hypothetical protein